MCLGSDEALAIETAHKYFRWSVTGWPVQAELDDPEGFASASKHIPAEAIAKQITCGPSVERHVAAVKKFVDAGFDHIILVQIGQDQDYFIDTFKSELAQAVRGLKSV
jgi:hypothetical protein